MIKVRKIRRLAVAAGLVVFLTDSLVGRSFGISISAAPRRGRVYQRAADPCSA